jgi:hypothetical protein
MDKEPIKKHWKQYKWWYIGAGVVVAVGVCAYILGKNTIDDRISMGDIDMGSQNVASPAINNGVLNYTVESSRQGPPSWVVQCLETGDVYSSQNKAAEALDLSSSTISQQINGIKPDAGGLHFKRI